MNYQYHQHKQNLDFKINRTNTSILNHQLYNLNKGEWWEGNFQAATMGVFPGRQAVCTKAGVNLSSIMQRASPSDKNNRAL
jgi:hypothetical protein